MVPPTTHSSARERSRSGQGKEQNRVKQKDKTLYGCASYFFTFVPMVLLDLVTISALQWCFTLTFLGKNLQLS